jgi:hypothetical protein
MICPMLERSQTDAVINDIVSMLCFVREQWLSMWKVKIHDD